MVGDGRDPIVYSAAFLLQMRKLERDRVRSKAVPDVYQIKFSSDLGLDRDEKHHKKK